MGSLLWSLRMVGWCGTPFLTWLAEHGWNKWGVHSNHLYKLGAHPPKVWAPLRWTPTIVINEVTGRLGLWNTTYDSGVKINPTEKNWVLRSHMNLSPGCWDFSVPGKSGTKVPTSIGKFGEWGKTLEWIGWVSNMGWICWTYTDQETVISDGVVPPCLPENNLSRRLESPQRMVVNSEGNLPQNCLKKQV